MDELVPLPVDIGSLARTIAGLDQSVNASKGRQFSLTIDNGGFIRIGEQGKLIIVDGDIILGEGKIDGKALKNQLAPGVVSKSGKSTVTASWSPLISQTLTKPDWCTEATVFVTAVGLFIPEGTVVGAMADIGSRFDINGVKSPVVSHGAGHMFSRVLQNSFATLIPLTGSTLKVTLEGQTGAGVQYPAEHNDVAISGFIQWMR